MIEEARGVFEQARAEVSRRAEAGREEERARGPAARLLLALTLAGALLTSALMFYGVYKFPDAPVRQTAEGFRGKDGRARTREEFEAFVLWQRVLFTVVPAVFVLGFAYAAADAARRRKGRRARGGG